jgi:curved DNA-binding protein CbpA
MLHPIPHGSAAMRIAVNEAAKILGVAVGTRGKDLKKALRKKIKENHPDVVKDDGYRLQQVREAYAVLEPEEVPDNWNMPNVPFEPHMQYKRASSPAAGGVGSWSSPSAQRKAAEMQREREERNAAARAQNIEKRGWMNNLMDEQMDNQVFMDSPGQHQWRGTVPTATMDWYKALTNIRVRAQPNVQSPALGTVIRQGETIKVNAELVIDQQKYLKLKDQEGWVFLRGIAGDWADRPILAKL